MGKKKDEDRKLSEVVNELIADVGDDRDRLVSFTEKLISEYDDAPATVAEYVAKLTDAATRQLQIKVAMVKALSKHGGEESDGPDADEIASEIGLPFPDEELDGSSN